jgi:hypothetical protein
MPVCTECGQWLGNNNSCRKCLDAMEAEYDAFQLDEEEDCTDLEERLDRAFDREDAPLDCWTDDEMEEMATVYGGCY